MLWLLKRGRINGGGHDLDEMESAAMLALTRAIRNYDPKNGAKFRTYLAATIERSCQRQLSHYRVSSYSKCEKRRANEISLSTPLRHREGETILDSIARSRLSSDGPPEISEDRREAFWKEVARRLVGTQREVIVMRFRDSLTFEQCGSRLGVTRERVRQIEAQAMQRLMNDPTLERRLDCA